jgi:glycosyltransferase involved in cell wall biosynthesis
MRCLIIQFARYGPYHNARLRAAHEVLAPLGWEVYGLEIAGTDATYAWDENKLESDGVRVITAFPGRVHEEITAAECRDVVFPLLDKLAPAAIAIAGWASPDASACLSWCRKHDVRRIVMSETRESDGKRVWWKELIKRYLISRFDAALVGGKSHRDYCVKLGIPTDKIQFGYNVVDNVYFAEELLKVGRSKVEGQDVRPYFLASNRFIKRKNLVRLVEAYFSYIQQSTIDNQQSTIWNLCLLGDGELKGALIELCQQLELSIVESAPWELQLPTASGQLPTVYFPGFCQIEALPKFYACAACFIHPALEEPWGLVINEAMASGLPILSGDNVGAAEELVDDGVNGWKFDASDVESIADCLSKVAALDAAHRMAMGAASAKILQERCPTEAFGRGLAAILGRLDR